MASSSRQHEKHKTQQTINYNKHHIQGSLTKLYKQDPPDCTLLRHHLGEFATTVTIFELSWSESNADNSHTNYAKEAPHVIETPSRTEILIQTTRSPESIVVEGKL